MKNKIPIKQIIPFDIFKVVDVGIAFDFCKSGPDESRLKMFFEKQYNGAQLPYTEYQCLLDDEQSIKEHIVSEKINGLKFNSWGK